MTRVLVLLLVHILNPNYWSWTDVLYNFKFLCFGASIVQDEACSGAKFSLHCIDLQRILGNANAPNSVFSTL